MECMYIYVYLCFHVFLSYYLSVFEIALHSNCAIFSDEYHMQEPVLQWTKPGAGAGAGGGGGASTGAYDALSLAGSLRKVLLHSSNERYKGKVMLAVANTIAKGFLLESKMTVAVGIQ